MNIRVKVAMLITAGIACATAASVAVFVSLQYASLRGAEEEKTRLLTANVAGIAKEAALAEDPLMLLSYLQNAGRDYKEIYRLRARIGGAWQEIGGSPGSEPAGGVLVEKPTPDIELWLSKDFLEQRKLAATRLLLQNTAWTAGLVVLAGLLLSIPLSWTMTRRLVLIEAGLREIGEGKLDSKLPALGSDEIARLAEQVNITAARLQDLESLKKEFIASVTHELRSPLGVIESHVHEFLKGPSPLSRQDRENMDRILNNTRRLGHFVTNLLNVARIERGKLDFSPRSADLQALVEDTVLFFKPRAHEAGISLSCSAQAGLPPIRLDPDLIGHVLTNLISNSLKFTRKGGQVAVTLKLAGDFAEVAVADSGIGIRAEDLQRIFAPFERVKNPLHSTGAGLGLAISKSIMDLHKGSIDAASEPGKGSRFRFLIPLQPQ